MMKDATNLDFSLNLDGLVNGPGGMRKIDLNLRA